MVNKFRSLRNDKPPATALLPLSSSFQEENHNSYFLEIDAALSKRNRFRIRNIALTGSYGVGKSSILQKVATTHRKKVVEISLSTLGVVSGTTDADKQAVTSVTNQIQKEIVKQILYQEDPSKMPQSRYKRVTKFKPLRGLLYALLIGIPVSAVFIAIGWDNKLLVALWPLIHPGLAIHCITALLLTFFIYITLVALSGRVWLEKLTAGNATISLSKANETFFDEYLEEIVYFFEVSRRDIVIFEDIDRFDDPHIFETLRALNTLLNSAKQLSGRSIRFIYAIKDSIFDDLGQRSVSVNNDSQVNRDIVDAELARSNRTKFFDLVIPVVPFITHRNARDLVSRVMATVEHNISAELIDLAGRHITDMRLIKNTRNEFVVFREKVLGGNGSDLGLNETSLFAMMLYKGTHLSDFEAIRIGTSKLDALYQASRQLVAHSIERLDAEALKLRKRQEVSDATIDRSEKLGEELLIRIQTVMSALKTLVRPSQRIFTLNGVTLDERKFHSPSFWKTFLSGNAELQVQVVSLQGYTHNLDFTPDDVSALLGVPLSIEDWLAVDSKVFEQRLSQIDESRKYLRNVDMAALAGRDDFTLDEPGGPSTFRQLEERFLESDLACRLVESGFIDRNFTLYVSTYYAEHVSSRARNFMIHNVDPNVMDIHFVLTAEDVEAILRERGDSILRERCSYNVYILDHLLERDGSRCDRLLLSLIDFRAEEKRFLQSYLETAKGRDDAVRKLSKRWNSILVVLVSELDFDDRRRTELVNTALECLSKDFQYETDEAVRKYIDANYLAMTCFSDVSITKAQASTIAVLLRGMGVRLNDISVLGPELVSAVVANNCYAITEKNLVTAVGTPADLGLDSLRDHRPGVYEYVLTCLPQYVSLFENGQLSGPIIASNAAFISIIEDVLERQENLLHRIVELSAPECYVDDLSNVKEAAWMTLAQFRRFAPILTNIVGYIDSIGAIDAGLAGILMHAGSIQIRGDVDETLKADLAINLLNASDVLKSPDLQVNLVKSLGLSGLIHTAPIEPQPGPFVGMLIEQRIIADDSESFGLVSQMDWETREFAISKSTHFQDFMTPTLVPSYEITRLLASAIIPDAVKVEVLNHPIGYLTPAIPSAIVAVADRALKTGKVLPLDVVEHLATNALPTMQTLALLEPNLPVASLEELTTILSLLPEPYSHLTHANGKRPKLPASGPTLALVRRLQDLDAVSSYDASQGLIRVNMRKS